MEQISVSYSHLDVYKRQLPEGAAGGQRGVFHAASCKSSGGQAAAVVDRKRPRGAPPAMLGTEGKRLLQVVAVNRGDFAKNGGNIRIGIPQLVKHDFGLDVDGGGIDVAGHGAAGEHRACLLYTSSAARLPSANQCP